MKLTTENIDHIAQLASLKLSDEEKVQYLGNLQQVLDHMEMIEQIDLSNVADVTSSTQATTPLRNDVVVQYDNVNLENNAPVWEDGCFKVPPILG